VNSYLKQIIYSKTINTTYKKMQNSQFTLLASTTSKVERLHDFVCSSTGTEEANKQRHNLDADPSSSTTKNSHLAPSGIYTRGADLWLSLFK